MFQLAIFVNNQQHEDPTQLIRISNQDVVRFELVIDFKLINFTLITDKKRDNHVHHDIITVKRHFYKKPSVDYEMTVTSDDEDFVKTSTSGHITIEKNTLFHDWLGNKTLAVYIDTQLFRNVYFNVTTTEERFYNIKRMMVYLMENEEKFLDICLSRQTSKQATINQTAKSLSSVESIIQLANNIIEVFDRQRHTLHKTLRHRLSIVKENVNVHNRHNINPEDIIDNLSQLYQGYSEDTIQIFNQSYALDNIERETHQQDYDLEENKILLGGLMSMKQLLWLVDTEVKKTHQKIQLSEKYRLNKTTKRLYGFGIEDLYRQLTIDSIQEEVTELIFKTDELLRLFQQTFHVTFEGFIPPRLSVFARHSSFYIRIYHYLNLWYDLGSPKMSSNSHFTKIESISKIYEIFTLYKLVDSLNERGWQVENQQVKKSSHPINQETDNPNDHDTLIKNNIPSLITFRKNSVSLQLYYEKKVFGYHPEHTKHNELVALKHYNNASEYNYYLPDFLIKRQDGHKVDYYILDAKYSNTEVLLKHKTLDKLYQKYYCDLAIYDDYSNQLHKQGIISVQAVLPFGTKRLSKWSEQMPQVIPEVSSLFLSQKQNELNKLIDLFDL